MSVAQTLIKQQYPHISGLMPTIIQGRNPLPKDSLQILHTDGDHRVAVSMFDTGDEDIVVYDSKYSSLSPSAQALLAKLVHTDKPTFTVKLANVTKQSGASDCGLYAIAYLIHIASGLNPSVVIFEQAKMRKHLIKCFEQKNIEPFPVIKERRMSIYPKTITIKFTAIAAQYMMDRKWWSAMVYVENGITQNVFQLVSIETRSGSVRTVVYDRIWHS